MRGGIVKRAGSQEDNPEMTDISSVDKSMRLMRSFLLLIHRSIKKHRKDQITRPHIQHN